MQALPVDGVERVLVVTAHPDDVDFGFAGSVAAWTDAGIAVVYCIVTDGEAGGADSGIDRNDMAAIRRDEQRAAAAVVGVDEVHFLGYPDGRVQATLQLRRDLSRVIRKVRPQRVVSQSPERNLDRIYASHPDHLAAGEATLCAVYPDARNRWAHAELAEEGLEPWTVEEVWIGSGAPGTMTHYVDTTATIDRKIEALRAHKSQITDPDAIGELVRGWAVMQAEQAALGTARCAELLRVVNTR